jgi:hypothetical protein
MIDGAGAGSTATDMQEIMSATMWNSVAEPTRLTIYALMKAVSLHSAQINSLNEQVFIRSYLRYFL